MGAWQIAVGTQQDNNLATTVCRSCGGNTSPRIPPLHSIASPYDIRQLLTATSFKFVESLEIRVTRHGLPATLHLISSSGSHSERANIRRFCSAHVVPGFITGRAPAHFVRCSRLASIRTLHFSRPCVECWAWFSDLPARPAERNTSLLYSWRPCLSLSLIVILCYLCSKFTASTTCPRCHGYTHVRLVPLHYL